ncbi:hypothetical protein THAOC_20274, partial [Thalassiosira oceanica]
VRWTRGQGRPRGAGPNRAGRPDDRRSYSTAPRREGRHARGWRGGEGAAATFAPPPPPASAGGGCLVARRGRPPRSGPVRLAPGSGGRRTGERHDIGAAGEGGGVGLASRPATPPLLNPRPGDWRRLSPAEAPARDGRYALRPPCRPPSRTRPAPRRALRRRRQTRQHR